jgi:hypothetical protein
MMSFSRLFIVPFVISMCAAAKAAPKPHYAYFCPSPPQYKNPFPQKVVFEQLPTAFEQNGSDFSKVIPPPEFRSHDFLLVVATEASLIFHSLSAPAGCQLIHIDAKGRIH